MKYSPLLHTTTQSLLDSHKHINLSAVTQTRRTSGNECGYIQQCCLDVIDVKCMHSLSVTHRLHLEEIRRPPGQEVLEVHQFGVVPVDARREDPRWRLAEADQRRLVLGAEINKTYVDKLTNSTTVTHTTDHSSGAVVWWKTQPGGLTARKLNSWTERLHIRKLVTFKLCPLVYTAFHGLRPS